MIIPVLKNDINVIITQKTEPNSISPAMVGGLMTNLADEQIVRGVKQLNNTGQLGTISGTDTNLCLVPGTGFFRFVNIIASPDNVTTFATADVGLWSLVDIPLSTPLGSFVEVTKSELDTLISSDDLIPGYEYLITDVDVPLYGGTPVILKAISKNKIANSGYGLFANPKYDKSIIGYGVWDNISSLVTSAATLIVAGDSISLTDSPGSTGIVVAVIGTQIFFRATSLASTWQSGTNLTNTVVTNTVSSRVIKNFSTGNYVIWGGKVWVNTSGHVGTADDMFTLSAADWNEVTYTFDSGDVNYGISGQYNLAIDEIEYDYENDLIVYRKEAEGSNEVRTSLSVNDILTINPIKAFQWGNPFDYSVTNRGIGAQTIINSLNENVNFRGEFQTDFVFKNYSVQKNIYFMEGSSQSFFDFNNGKQLNSTLLRSTQTQIIFNNYTIDRNITGNNTVIISSNEANTIAEKNSVKYTFSVTFDGSNGAGLENTAVKIPFLSVLQGSFMEEVLVDGVGLVATHIDAFVNLGVSIDAPQNALNDITGVVSDLNSGITKVADSTFTKATGLRKMVMSVGNVPLGTGTITAGTLYVVVKLGKIS
jgi:hypothetical protein